MCDGVSKLMAMSLSEEQVALLCKVLIVLMLVPLLAIAPYNYPADDDFQFVLPAATAWVETGSLVEVFKAIVQKTYEIYHSWQGNFVSTFFFGLTPMVFDIDLYFLSNWALLCLLCLAAGYLVESVTGLLKASRSAFWIVYAAALVLVVAFMPYMGYSVFWHNGGQYTTAAATLFVTLGLIIRCMGQQSTARAIWRCAALAVCGFMLGGSFYGPALGALVLIGACGIWTLFTPFKAARAGSLCALIGFLPSFYLSVTAPGNTLRQTHTGEALGVAETLLTTVLDSFDLAAQWMQPQLLAMLALICAAMWRPLRDSQFSFRHPIAVMVGLYGLFSASLAPGIYTQTGYDTQRYMNALYLYFLVFAVGTVLYAEGRLIRRMQQSDKLHCRQLLAGANHLGRRFTAGFLALVIALTIFGGFGFTIMNVSSVNAVKCLVTGEAAQFKADMQERQEYIRVTDSDVVAVQPLASQPYIFKYDRLPFQGIYGRVRYMKWYFELFANRP